MDDAQSRDQDNETQRRLRSIVSLLHRLRLARSVFSGDSFSTAFREVRGTIDPRIDLEL